jgi:general secretion pathway protein C
MIDKIQLGRWDNAITSWGEGLNVPQLLWGLRIAVLALAILACVYALVQFFVLMTTSGGESVEQLQLQGSTLADNPAAELNVETVKSWGWYSDREAGSVDVSPSAAAQDSVKQTRLQMRLEGIVKSGSDEDSVAIIEINKQSKQYQIGAKLPVGARVYLRTIEVDRIILDNNGSLEELLLFDKNLVNQRRSSSAPAPGPGQGGVIDKSANQDVTAMMGRYRQQIQKNPGSINKLIKFSVHTEDGKLAGFKIGAANNRNDFAQLGLEDGDVVTHVNGVELSDYRKALSLYQEMGDLSEVRVQLIRQGQSQELVFSLPGEG